MRNKIVCCAHDNLLCCMKCDRQLFVPDHNILVVDFLLAIICASMSHRLKCASLYRNNGYYHIFISLAKCQNSANWTFCCMRLLVWKRQCAAVAAIRIMWLFGISPSVARATPNWTFLATFFSIQMQKVDGFNWWDMNKKCLNFKKKIEFDGIMQEQLFVEIFFLYIEI